MKILKFVFCLFLMAGFVACTSSTSSSGGSSDDETVTEAEAESAGAEIFRAQSAAYLDIWNQFAEQGYGMTISDALKATKSGSIVLNSVYNCQIDGHITLTGNFEWTSNYPVPPDDNTPYSWSNSGQLKQDFSDPTNNLNDCEMADDFFLDGTLYSQFTASGDMDSSEARMSTDGTVEYARRGPTGGLVPIGNCNVFFTVTATVSGSVTSGSAIGTICGYSYSYTY